MRIVIDLQGAQSSGSRGRGIGRYSKSLVKAIVSSRGKHEIILALNGLFLEAVDELRAEFTPVLGAKNIRTWIVPAGVSYVQGNHKQRQAAELIREAFFASLNPDVILVTSLFEGFCDETITSIATKHSNVLTATILYDLIPYINRSIYLENPELEAWYETKIDHCRRSDLLLSISESSREEGLKYLGFSETDIVNISTAADECFQPHALSSDDEAALRKRYALSRPFVMYTGGIDHRKNIEGLIRAFALLPKNVRKKHQLAIVCNIHDADKVRLENLAKSCGLSANTLVLTGFIPEDDLIGLYNLCTLFVFPSWHEGFGLPVLEAMACGRAVIGSDASSIPEVIGRQDALFDPRNDNAIAKSMLRVLTDTEYRTALEDHARVQAKNFSWQSSAQKAIQALEALHEKSQSAQLATTKPLIRRKLAYVSPLPPERSGISDYSADLLRVLSRYYEVVVIVEQEVVSDPWVQANCRIHDARWLKSNSNLFDRVLYHFGNSHFHQHMFELLQEVPGVVVLHDFFLSGIAAHMEVTGAAPGFWVKQLYQSHGYRAVEKRFQVKDTAEVVWEYPCNLSVLEAALGVIVHSPNSLRLAQEWYGNMEKPHWATVPLLRNPPSERDRVKSREELGLKPDDFVICSFGLMGMTKLNQRLLDCFLASELSQQSHCHLVFVGENDAGEYGKTLLKTIQQSRYTKQIHITGWADTDIFEHYLAAADMAVQLRTLSRGETSAAVLDCMNYGLPTIVNANGSMNDLPDQTVFKLPDEFSDSQLTEALELIWHSSDCRNQLSAAASDFIRAEHAPVACAAQYFSEIERFYSVNPNSRHGVVKSLSSGDLLPADAESLKSYSRAIAHSFSPSTRHQQLFIDVSELVVRESCTGIQIVIRNILFELLKNPPKGYRVEPVYATPGEFGYRYARHFTLSFLSTSGHGFLRDEEIEYCSGDVFLGLDTQPSLVVSNANFFNALKRSGVSVYFTVYDLLSITHSRYFSAGAYKSFRDWLMVVIESDGALCISHSVASELRKWIGHYGRLAADNLFKIETFHLGAELQKSFVKKTDESEQIEVLKSSTATTFLMVGTIEPIKSYQQVLSAFDLLWEENLDVRIVLVGKQGFLAENIVDAIQTHPEFGSNLFWLSDISDFELENVYRHSDCLIAASEGEGFGLPLIEAAQHKLPIIARDIAVFKEVAGRHAFYFNASGGGDLADTIQSWLELFEKGEHPRSDDMPWLTCKQSTQQLLSALDIQ